MTAFMTLIQQSVAFPGLKNFQLLLKPLLGEMILGDMGDRKSAFNLLPLLRKHHYKKMEIQQPCQLASEAIEAVMTVMHTVLLIVRLPHIFLPPAGRGGKNRLSDTENSTVNR